MQKIEVQKKKELISKFRFNCENKTPNRFNIVYVQTGTFCDKDCDYCYLDKLKIKDIKNNKDKKDYLLYYKTIDLFKEEMKNDLVFAMVGGEPILFDFESNFEMFNRYKSEKFIWFTHLMHQEKTFDTFINNFKNIYEIHQKHSNSIINISLHLQFFSEDIFKLFFNNVDTFIELFPDIEYHINVVFDERYIKEFNQVIDYIYNKNYNFYLTLKNNDADLLKYFDFEKKQKTFDCRSLVLNPYEIMINKTEIYNFSETFDENRCLKEIKKMKFIKNNFCDNFNNCEDRWKGMTVFT